MRTSNLLHANVFFFFSNEVLPPPLSLRDYPMVLLFSRTRPTVSDIQGGHLLLMEAAALVLQRWVPNSNIAPRLFSTHGERAFFSASADVLQRGILLPSSELPGYSSNQMALSPSCYRAFTPAIACALFTWTPRYTILLSFSLNANRGILEFLGRVHGYDKGVE